MKRKAVCALLLFLLTTPPVFAEKVMYVNDGDTLRLVNGQRIRIFGIDAPELKQEPFGVQSKRYLIHLVKDKDVQLVECVGKSFKRRVCSISVEGKDIGELMVMAGYAFDSPKYSKTKYLELQSYAQENKLGMWQNQVPKYPWAYRKEKRPK
jgi:micrococcal nuclease